MPTCLLLTTRQSVHTGRCDLREAVQFNGKNCKKLDDVGKSLGVDGGRPGHLVWMEEGQVTWCEWRKARSLGVDGGRPGHLVQMEEGQVTWCGWWKARSLGVDGGRPGHLV